MCDKEDKPEDGELARSTFTSIHNKRETLTLSLNETCLLYQTQQDIIRFYTDENN
jgi:hypothetical protein